MKQLMNISLMLMLLQLPFSAVTAQAVQDSRIQKMIAGERAFYETLGNIYPAESTVTVH
jgi:monoterpene epsilon-lactone hydrolase